MAAPIGLRLLLDGMSWKRKNPTEPASSALEGSSLALGDVQVCASQGRRGRNTGSYVDRGERREVRAWAPRSAERFPFQGTRCHVMRVFARGLKRGRDRANCVRIPDRVRR